VKYNPKEVIFKYVCTDVFLRPRSLLTSLSSNSEWELPTASGSSVGAQNAHEQGGASLSVPGSRITKSGCAFTSRAPVERNPPLLRS